VDSVGKPPLETNLFLYTGNNPINRVDPEGLFWGIPMGESYGDFAAQYWANKYNESGNALHYLAGLAASLWTPETSFETTSTLAGGYCARVLGPFSTKGVPNQLQRLRKYFRVDPPHHGKGWHFDGDLFK
jgi:hypothetical protein